MAVVKTLARDWDFFANTGTDETPTWVPINGINSASWGVTKNDADTTTYDDEGNATHLVASRGKNVTLSGIFMEDPDNGDRDPGQEACETWAEAIGPDSLRKFKAQTPGGTTIIGLASCSVNPGGGGNDDPTAWECAVTWSGKPDVTPPA